MSVLFLLLSVAWVAPLHREIDEWYARVAWGPALERALGFRMASGAHPAYPEMRGELDFIGQIEPGGIFERAGFRVGDVFFRRCSFCQPDIYIQLEWSRGGYTEIDVLRRPGGPRTQTDSVTLEVGVPEREAVVSGR